GWGLPFDGLRANGGDPRYPRPCRSGGGWGWGLPFDGLRANGGDPRYPRPCRSGGGWGWGLPFDGLRANGGDPRYPLPCRSGGGWGWGLPFDGLRGGSPVDGVGYRSHRLVQPQAIDHRTGRVRVPVVEEVPEAKVHRVPAHLLRDDVHLRLVGPAHLHDAEAAKGPGGRLIGVDAEGVDADVGDDVRARAGVPRLVRDPRPDVGVGARIPQDLAVAGEEPAVAGHARREGRRDAMLGDGVELLLAAETHLDGAPGRAGEERCDRLELHVELAAEPAAQIWDHDPNVRLRQVEHVGEHDAHVGGAL